MASVSCLTKAEILSVQTVVADGRHNAFPGLCRWQDDWYIAYRQALAHNPSTPRGVIIVMRSGDNAKTWEHAAILATGGDDRDPTFLVQPDSRRLGLLWGTYSIVRPEIITMHPQINPYLLMSHVAWTTDGALWSYPTPAYRWEYWLWSGLCIPGRMTEDGYAAERWYAAAYHRGETGDNTTLHLVSSSQGLKWVNHCQIADYYDTNLTEPVLFADPDTERLWCLARRDEIPSTLTGGVTDFLLPPVLGSALPPYTRWTWQQLNVPMHPASCVLTPHGWIVGARTFAENSDRRKRAKPEYCTSIWHLGLGTGQLTRLLTLPSHGDCAYPSLVWDENRLMVAYYSSRHSPDLGIQAADILLATVTLENTDDVGHEAPGQTSA